MAELLILFGLGSLTALACGLGAIPVFALGERVEQLRPALWGLAAGLMALASVVGLLVPALEEGEPAAVGGDWRPASRSCCSPAARSPGATCTWAGSAAPAFAAACSSSSSCSCTAFPEGFAIGTAYASERAGLGVFVILAIALQNVPEGTSVAIPMREAGFTAAQQFWAAVATSAPQPVGAVIAFALVELDRRAAAGLVRLRRGARCSP